ncbi:branched-chain amino acid ABC transporter permease [Desulfomonile tiedjei]|uniref:ABC-type branched-chain amino acid transport system, permease component n=1 Tax=Desulfomonile tiedjei (strain ATCC 49306 / DSM 6799 / DCB-1) TaxID=706587 RepID=I4C8D7_DESTA|nr:branched-chain amino acid ABC transporter permease [Desulfomonile tiedjei]AFM25828.1 ABC-type branched-chain amino acid transport system, permease component [Desulfomonile tiedjei DSM 6799]
MNATQVALKRRKERIDRGIKVRSDDIFALTSYKEMLYVSVPPVLPVAVLLVLPLVLPPYWQKVLISTAVFALLAISWDFLVCVGMVSLGQALFFGVGAYVAGVLDHYAGLPIWLGIPLATVIGGGLCTVFLIPVLRLRGVYFSMVTLVLPLMLERIVEATGAFGGTEGLTGLKSFPNQWIEQYLIIVAVLVALFGFRRLMTTDYGLVLKAIRDNDRSVMSGGLNIYWFKAQALFITGCMGSFCGAYMTHVYMFVGMPSFALDYSILPLASAVVGGMGTFAGSFIGAFILVPLSEALRGIGGLRIVFYSLFLVVFIVALPEGIFHYVQRKYQQFERWVTVDK